MTASQIIDRAREIDDQNSRMTGLVVAGVCSVFSAILITLFLI